MENFSLDVKNIRRESSLFLPVSYIAYRKKDCCPNPNPFRQTVNFGVILSSPTGRTRYQINGQLFESSVPAFVFTCPGPEYVQPDSEPVEKIYISYPPDTLPYFRFFTVPEHVLTPFRADFNLGGILNEINQHCRKIRHPGEADRLDACWMRMIQEIQLSASLQTRDRDRTDEAVYLIATYLDLHFAENPDLETLARHHGMSYRTFLRRWNALFSLTPALAIRKRKIREACRLLEETSLKIYEIAARVGFEDPYYFMRIFHADMKQSPSRYRKALREQGERETKEIEKK